MALCNVFLLTWTFAIVVNVDIRRVSGTTIPDIRFFSMNATIGRFAVRRVALELEIERRKLLDQNCGNNAELTIHANLSSHVTNMDEYGEIFVAIHTTAESIAQELPRHLREKFEAPIKRVGIFVPITSSFGSGLLLLEEFVDNFHFFPSPTNPSDKAIAVDVMEVNHSGVVTLRIGHDVMVLTALPQNPCRDDSSVGRDFDEMSSKRFVTFTSYPYRPTFGCDFLGWNVSFCRALNQYRCELDRSGGDVCTIWTTGDSVRCRTTMTIDTATGVFRKHLPYLADGVTPLCSFEAEQVERQHGFGLRFPCVTSD